MSIRSSSYAACKDFIVMAQPYPYPPIPADCVDRQGTLPVGSSHSPRESSLVSSRGGRQSSARGLCDAEQSTPASHAPPLADAVSLYVQDDQDDWQQTLGVDFRIHDRLIQNRKDIEASWLEGYVPSFGFLRLGYDVAVHYSTKTVVRSGNPVRKELLCSHTDSLM
ncbi:hypothetical protein N7510_001062 [Penicillium lagena]|uniref:uncharacterized protein n=1 Tax=Penicillium lagena TaxID=94218 RepID=UPI002541B324|nr:uncharacterized protein N7510_001062 [Penicillium lagena]KAJ5624753.1 hypothetical protein N7510_001062 [Penicillium lagena]